MIEKTVLELQVENINLRVFTIFTAGPNQAESFQEAEQVDKASPSGRFFLSGNTSTKGMAEGCMGTHRRSLSQMSTKTSGRREVQDGN